LRDTPVAGSSVFFVVAMAAMLRPSLLKAKLGANPFQIVTRVLRLHAMINGQ
jgi:hypothetical protein